MPKIYTKKGDAGKTSDLSGNSCNKASLLTETVGAVDELNSHVGLCHASLLNSESGFVESANTPLPYKSKDILNQLEYVMSRLLDVGAELSQNKHRDDESRINYLSEDCCRVLEFHIDKMEEVLPKLKNFILPTGTITSGHAHVCRSVARRAERMVISLHNRDNIVPLDILKLMNRLSDYFFVIARYVHRYGGDHSDLVEPTDIIYKPTKK